MATAIVTTEETQVETNSARAIVSRMRLINALTEVSRAIDKKGTIPIVNTVLICAENNKITLQATNLEVSVEQTIQAQTEASGAICIPSRFILPWLTELDAENVTLDFEAYKLRITGEHGETAMVEGLSVDSFPGFPSPGESGIRISSAVLLRAIHNTRYAISREGSRFTINGCLLKIESGRLTLIATDGHRLVVQAGATEGAAKLRCIIPRKALAILEKRFTERQVESVLISTDNNQVYFKLDDGWIGARKIDVKFPDYTKVTSRHPRYSVAIPDANALLAALRRIGYFADEQSRMMCLEFSGSRLELTSSISETGSARESLKIETEAPNTKIALNAQYVMDAVGCVAAPARLSFTDSVSPVEIADDSGYSCTIMPMRM
jgi:DNA polymerase III subunit beta